MTRLPISYTVWGMVYTEIKKGPYLDSYAGSWKEYTEGPEREELYRTRAQCLAAIEKKYSHREEQHKPKPVKVKVTLELKDP